MSILVDSPITTPAIRGQLRLCAERIGDRTILRNVFRTTPFHLGPPSYRAGAGRAEVIVQQVGPGVMPGDELSREIAVGPGASLTVRDQAATKLYPCPPDTPAHANLVATVEAGGELILLNGELIPFHDAEYRQTSRIDLHGDARLALVEIITPGRMAMGEDHSYRRLTLRTDIFHDERPLVIERTQLDPRRGPPNSPAVHGPFAVVGLMVLVGYDHRAATRGGARSAAGWWAADGDERLTIMRAVGRTTQTVQTWFASALARLGDSGG